MKVAQPTFLAQPNESSKLLIKWGVGKTTKDYQKNQNIFVQGEDADTLLFIEKGRVKIAVTSSQGKEAVVGILDEGQFFGEGCLQGTSARTVTATALGVCRVTEISKDSMLSAMRDQPQIFNLFMDHLLTRNSRIQEDVVDQLLNSSEKRLARLLLLLANYGKEGSPPIVPIVINQETLAEMIGTTRSRVSFFMNKFRKLGFIDYNGKIDVHPALLNST
ncbi:Crp/Fnr family transcriptional regulator [Rhodopseudomonas sp. P2A-2r]|uniref:Crp/Fnr family transcriptional regulator n=1 Tax=unclassified Rhodopseudomonas TaxID=2638247 RepID=UPI002234B73A|nr:Crp/Fnr family transcriptional regulator [Rhodopseudomonas sp. P2A-2r]UZE47374.1 Crp/Fnr family transcriptional regulator [Rhodopseudomonas sp. P2A-2r]